MNINSGGILFDGFPRTVVQAYILEGLLLKMNTSLTCMLSLEVPNDMLMERMLERAKTSGRSDDNLEVIKVRLNEYENKTKPVIDFYQEKGKYFPINGVGTIDSIFKELCHTIDNTFKQDYFNVVLLGKPGSGKGTQGEIAIKLIEKKIERNPSAAGFIFKGFPRTIVQAYILDGLLRRMNSRVSCMLNLKLTTLEAIKRLNDRGKTDRKRPYDLSTDMILNRLDEYEKKTKPVIDYYKKQSVFFEVDGTGTEDEVNQRLEEAVRKEMGLSRG